MAADPTQLLAVDIPTAARLVSIGRTKAYEEIAGGRLRTVRVGRRRLVTRQALTDYIDLLTAERDAE